jgi:hypothetical protein
MAKSERLIMTPQETSCPMSKGCWLMAELGFAAVIPFRGLRRDQNERPSVSEKAEEQRSAEQEGKGRE